MGTESPHERSEDDRETEKVTVWCEMLNHHVNGLYYFDHPIVNGDTYISSLNNIFLPILPSLPSDTIFEQDGAPTHYRKTVGHLLDEKLPGLWIGRRVPIRWPAHSSDLIRIKVFSRVYVKDNISQTPHHNLTRLRKKIASAIRIVNVHILQTVENNNEAGLCAVRREKGLF